MEKSFVALGSYSFQMDAPYAAPEWFRYQADVKFEGVVGLFGHSDGMFCLKSGRFIYLFIF